MTEQKEKIQSVRDNLSELSKTADSDAYDFYEIIENCVSILDEVLGNQQTFKVGEYCRYDDIIFKVLEDGGTYLKTFELITKTLKVDGFYKTSGRYEESVKATADEIALFKRAEHFHSKGRKLNEFKQGDIVNNSGKAGYVTYVSTNKKVMHVCFSDSGIQIEYTPETFDLLTLIMTAEELGAAAAEARKC